MKKLIAKTFAGKEYIYCKHDTYQANQSKIDLICKAMNDTKYKLKTGELYHVYTVSDYTYKQAFYKVIHRHNKLSIYEIWSVYN